MNIAKFALSLGFVGLAALNAQVNYIGNTADADVTTVINLASDPTATYGGSYDSATKTWTWLAAETNVLQEVVVITGGNLYIEPGSIVRGQPRTDASTYNPGALLIARGAKLLAAGDSSTPIVFTTATVNANPANGGTGSRATGSAPAFWDADPINAPKNPGIAGLWGGVLICGNAPQNADRVPATALQDYFDITGNNTASTDDRFPIEGIPTGSAANTGGYDRFGGFATSDNSGVLSYLSIRHGGANLAANNEINGLTLGGVGSGTTVNNIEIWGNTDDGVELFGGTVNLQNILIVAPQDDGLDVDTGYTGTVQFIAVIASGLTDKLGEWDGSYQGETYQSVVSPTVAGDNFPTQFQVANATFIGNSNGTFASGLHIRDQSAPRLVNSIIVNASTISGAGPIEVDNRAGVTASTNSTARFSQEVAYFKGVTFSGASLGTVAAAVANGSADAVIEAKISEAKFENIFGGAPGFLNVPTGGNLPANLKLDPRPTADASAAFDDQVLAGNASYKVVSFRGAFDPNETQLWSANWSAADVYGLIIK